MRATTRSRTTDPTGLDIWTDGECLGPCFLLQGFQFAGGIGWGGANGASAYEPVSWSFTTGSDPSNFNAGETYADAVMPVTAPGVGETALTPSDVTNASASGDGTSGTPISGGEVAANSDEGGKIELATDKLKVDTEADAAKKDAFFNGGTYDKLVKAANDHNTCATCLATQSAIESDYFSYPAAVKNNNPLGIDDWHADTKTLTIHDFASVDDAIKAYFNGWGKTLNGKMNMNDYAHALEDGPHVRYNSQDPKGYMKSLNDGYDQMRQDIQTYYKPHT
jgi:hypothetical protein